MAINPVTGTRIQRGTGASVGPVGVTTASDAPLRAEDEVRKGFRRGVGQVIGLTQNTIAAGQAALGFEEAAQERLDESQQFQEEVAQTTAPAVGKVEDIRHDSFENFYDDVSLYLAQLVGSQTPILGAMAAAGVVGGVAGSRLATRGLSASSVAAQQAGLRGVGIGATVGSGAGSTVLETGSIFGDIAADPEAEGTLQEQAFLSAGGGLVAGSLDALPIFQATRRLGAANPLGRSLLNRAARAAVPQAATEAVTEAAQTLVERGTHAFVNKNFEILGPEGASELLNAAVAGGILGGGLGAVTGALQRSGPTENDLIEEEESIEALNRVLLERRVEVLRGSIPDEQLDALLDTPVVTDELLDEVDSITPAEILEARNLSRREYIQGLDSQGHTIEALGLATEHLESGRFDAMDYSLALDTLQSRLDQTEEVAPKLNRQEAGYAMDILKHGVLSEDPLYHDAAMQFIQDNAEKGLDFLASAARTSTQEIDALTQMLDSGEIDPAEFAYHRETAFGITDSFQNFQTLNDEIDYRDTKNAEEGDPTKASNPVFNRVPKGPESLILSRSTGTFYTTEGGDAKKKTAAGLPLSGPRVSETIEAREARMQAEDPRAEYQRIPARTVIEMEATLRHPSKADSVEARKQLETILNRKPGPYKETAHVRQMEENWGLRERWRRKAGLALRTDEETQTALKFERLIRLAGQNKLPRTKAQLAKEGAAELEFIEQLKQPETKAKWSKALKTAIKLKRMQSYIHLIDAARGREGYIQDEIEKLAKIRGLPLTTKDGVPIDILEDEWAIQKSEALPLAQGQDPFELVEDDLNPAMPEYQRQKRARIFKRLRDIQNANIFSENSDENFQLVEERRRALKELENSDRNRTRFVRWSGSAASEEVITNERQLEVTIDGAPRKINVPQLVKRMLVAQEAAIDRSTLARNLGTKKQLWEYTAQEIAQAFGSAIASLQSVRRNLPNADPELEATLKVDIDSINSELTALENQQFEPSLADQNKIEKLRAKKDKHFKLVLARELEERLDELDIIAKKRERRDAVARNLAAVRRAIETNDPRLADARSSNELAALEDSLSEQLQDLKIDPTHLQILENEINRIQFVDVDIPSIDHQLGDLTVLTDKTGKPMMLFSEIIAYLPGATESGKITPQAKQFHAYMEKLRERVTAAGDRAHGKMMGYIQHVLEFGLPTERGPSSVEAAKLVGRLRENKEDTASREALTALRRQFYETHRTLSPEERAYFIRMRDTLAKKGEERALIAEALGKKTFLGSAPDPFDLWMANIGDPTTLAQSDLELISDNTPFEVREAKPRVIIAGGRDFTDPDLMVARMQYFLGGYDLKDVTTLSGAAKGADKVGEIAATELGIPVDQYPAKWKLLARPNLPTPLFPETAQKKKIAGALRNKDMAQNATHLIAFWDGVSSGTKNMIDIAKDSGLDVRVVLYGKESTRTFYSNIGMKYSMPVSGLRKNLKTQYPDGTTTMQLIQDGHRTATTRSKFAGVGDIISFKEEDNKHSYRVTAIEPINVEQLKKDANTRATWEQREGWDLDYVESNPKLAAQVFNKNAVQTIFERIPADIQSEELIEASKPRRIFNSILEQGWNEGYSNLGKTGDVTDTALFDASQERGFSTEDEVSESLDERQAPLQFEATKPKGAELRGDPRFEESRVKKILTQLGELPPTTVVSTVGETKVTVRDLIRGIRGKTARESALETASAFLARQQAATKGKQGSVAAPNVSKKKAKSADTDTVVVGDDIKVKLKVPPKPSEARQAAVDEAADTMLERIAEGDLKTQEGLFNRLRRRGARWNKKLNLKGYRLINTVSMVNILRKRGDLELLQSMLNNQEYGLSVGETVWVNPLISEDAQYEVLAHEMGHVLAYNTAPSNVAPIFDAWTKWRKEVGKGKLKDIAKARQAINVAIKQNGSLKETKLSSFSDQDIEYILDFEEWFADQTAAWLIKEDAKPRNSTERWMDKFVNGMRQLFADAKEDEVIVDESVQHFIEEVIHTDAFANARVQRAVRKDIRSAAALAAEDPSTKYAFHAVQAMLKTGWLTEEPKNALAKAFASNSVINRKIQARVRPISPVTAELISRNVDIAIAYGFQMWTEGEIDLGPAAQSAFDNFTDNIFRALGEVGDFEQASNVAEQLKKDIALLQKAMPEMDTKFADQLAERKRSGGKSSYVVSKVLRESRLQKIAQRNKEIWGKYAKKLFDKVFVPSVRRMIGTGNAALIEISMRFYTPPGTRGRQEGYLQARSGMVSRWLGQFARNIGNDLDEETATQVLTALQQGTIGDQLDQLPDDVKTIVRSVRKTLDEMWDYGDRAGLHIRSRGRKGTKGRKESTYFPWVYDMEQLIERRDEWVEMMTAEAHRPIMEDMLKQFQETKVNPTDPDDDTTLADQFNINNIQDVAGYFHSQLIGDEGYADTAAVAAAHQRRAVRSDVELRLDKTGHVPFVAALNARGLNFLQAVSNQELKDKHQSFLSQDINHTLRVYTEQLVKRAEFHKQFKVHGDGTTEIDNLLDQAKELGATHEQLQLAHDFVDAMQGTLGGRTNQLVTKMFTGEDAVAGQIINPKLQTLFSATILWQNMRVLALSAFVSLADPIGILVRGGPLDVAFDAMKAGFKVNDKEMLSTKVATALGIIDTYSIDEALASTFGTNFQAGSTRLWNERFFHWTQLNRITRVSRAAATGAALTFIKRHATDPNSHSQRFLDELNLTAEDVKLDANGELMVLTRPEINALYEINEDFNKASQKILNDTAIDDEIVEQMSKEEFAQHKEQMKKIREEAEKKAGIPKLQTAAIEALSEIERDQRIRGAIRRFVDESILRPSAATRPIWASDPHFQLLFHLKSFMYTFHDVILRRVGREAINGNWTPMASLLWFIPVMMFADYARDWFRFGGPDPKKANWDFMDWTMHSVERAGLPGLGMMLMDAAQDRQYGGVGVETFLGPTASSLLKTDDLLFGPERWNAFLDQLPAQNTVLYEPVRS